MPLSSIKRAKRFSVDSFFDEKLDFSLADAKPDHESPVPIQPFVFFTDDNNELLQSGTKWLKDMIPAFSTGFDKSTSAIRTPSTLKIVNTSCTTVNELPDFRKKKTKYVRYGKTNIFLGIEMCWFHILFIFVVSRNGYVEKLQTLLTRQASNLNFVRHNLNLEYLDKGIFCLFFFFQCKYIRFVVNTYDWLF